MRITPLAPYAMPNLKGPAAPESTSGAFATALETKIAEVNQLQNQSDEVMSQGAVNGATNIHESMIQLEEADISLRMLTKVRNKAMEAYQEIMRMQF